MNIIPGNIHRQSYGMLHQEQDTKMWPDYAIGRTVQYKEEMTSQCASVLFVSIKQVNSTGRPLWWIVKGKYYSNTKYSLGKYWQCYLFCPGCSPSSEYLFHGVLHPLCRAARERNKLFVTRLSQSDPSITYPVEMFASAAHPLELIAHSKHSMGGPITSCWHKRKCSLWAKMPKHNLTDWIFIERCYRKMK